MKLGKFLLPLALMAGMSISAFGSEQSNTREAEELNERDFEALREYIRMKRDVPLEAKDESMSITGDIHFEWRHMHEEINGVSQRGHGATDRYNEILLKDGNYTQTFSGGLPISNNDFDIEFNLYFDYRTKCTWASAQLGFDNGMGIDDGDQDCEEDRAGWHGSGICSKLCLKKAYFGGLLWNDDCSSIELEMGRRGNLYKVFDSKVQFLSRLDGILFVFNAKLGSFAEWYAKTAAFVIDERVNHFGFVGETGLLNIKGSGIDLKYSLISWNKPGINRFFVRHPEGFKFLNSQVTMAYHLNPELLSRPATIFGAVVYNHGRRCRVLAEKQVCKVDTNNLPPPPVKMYPPTFSNGQIYQSFLHGHKYAWYLGCLIGEVKKEGDWSFETQYQYVTAFSIPDGDCSGIGLGNVQGESLTGLSNRGSTNFKGWRFEGMYAITDDITLDTIVEFSKAIDERIELGGRHRYSKFELEAMYTF